MRPTAAEPLIEVVASGDLGRDRLVGIRALLDDAFGARLDEHDWEHALGGLHVLARTGPDGALIGHAAVVERELWAGSRPLRTGYVEAVATLPTHQRRGVGLLVMGRVGQVIRQGGYDMGALATGVNDFYRRLGWQDWLGTTAVREGSELRPTPEEDGAVMVLCFGASAELDLELTLSVPPRSGDDW